MDYKTDFDPRGYLQEYYTNVGSENFALIRFAVKAFRTIPPDGLLLDFGSGPTIYPLIAAVDRVGEIHICDYLDTNLAEIQLWLQSMQSAFDWQEFFKVTLELENGGGYGTQAIMHREALIRQRVTQIFNCNANHTPPINPLRVYDVLVTNFCVEAATSNLAEWRKAFSNVLSLLKPNGTLLMATLKNSTRYPVGDKTFPAVSLSETDLTQALIEEGFDKQSIVIESVDAEHSFRQYKGFMLALAKKRG